MITFDPPDRLKELRYHLLDSIDELKTVLKEIEILMSDSFIDERHNTCFNGIKEHMLSGLEELETFDEEVLRRYQKLIETYLEL